MAANNRRVVRMLCKAHLLISLPLAGFVWALPDDATNLAAAATLALVSLAVGFGLSSGDSDSLPGNNLPKRNCVIVLFIGFVLVEDSKMKACFQ